MDILQENILQGLNQRQEQAVRSITGSTLVIAGAGSGKTSVLTRRCAYLIGKGLVPGRILCLTFTNKAAAEMNARVVKLLNKLDIYIPAIKPWMTDYQRAPLLSTFHSLGLRLLREFGERLELKSTFTILDTDDQKKIVKELIKARNLDPKNYHHDLVLYFISQCKQELLLAADSRKISRDFQVIFHQLYADYERTLRTSQAVDFDDLILLPYILLRDNFDVLETLRERWTHVMVDEFQDTNQAQFELVRMLAPDNLIQAQKGDELSFDPDKSRSLFVVGDDAQSIYSFRGSKVEIILNFEYEYPETKTIVLNQNYRSTQPILDLAEKIISLNSNQKKKELFTENPEKVQIKYYLARNEQAEAEYILRQLHLQYGLNSEDQRKKESNEEFTEVKIDADEEIKVMYDDFDEYLRNSSSTPSFSNSPTVKSESSATDAFVSDMFDVYLELDNKPTYTSSRHKFVDSSAWHVPAYDWSNMPKLNDVAVLYRTHGQSRALEEVFLRYKLPYRLASGTRFLDRKEIKDALALFKFIQNSEDMLSLKRFLPLVLDGVGPKTMDKIIYSLQNPDEPMPTKAAAQIHSLYQQITHASENNTSLIDFAKEVLSATGYLSYLKHEYPVKEELEARMENISELYSLMYPFDVNEDNTISNQPLTEKLQSFLEQISLMTNLDSQNESENQPKVTLMSLHQSKGLEFETVFLVGLEDGILPHINSFEDYRGLEEEVRLAYVGVTRAKKYLHLTAAESRIQFGQIKANPVSRIFRPLLDKHAQRVR
ncbi:MAG: hypothetical protein OHK0017_07120 [Patescibacteria group bacterium]